MIIYVSMFEKVPFSLQASFYGAKATSVDPDQTPHTAVSDQDLHFLLTECSIKF